MLIKTEILGFVLKQEPSTPPNLMMGVKTIWELCLFEVGPFGSLKRLQMGIFTFLTERDWSWKRCYGNSIKGVILFLFWCTFVMPSFKNTASIFPEISFIQYFPLFSCKQYDIISDLICIIEKLQYLWNEKRYFKKKNAILLYFESLSNKHKLFFTS